jgi:putative nucleotidyltransferase with HDIG domain
LGQAVPRLGYNEVYRLVATVISESTLGGTQAGYGIAAGELWQHSVAAAVAGRLVAQALGFEENLIFTAALLHDIGKLVLSGYLANCYASIQRETEVSHRSFLEVERMLLGVDHAEVGGRLLASWGFPDKLVQAVWRHHEPDRARAFAELAASVCLGDVIAHLVGHGHGYQAFALRIQSDLLHRLKLDATQLELLAVQTETTLRQMAWFVPHSP